MEEKEELFYLGFAVTMFGMAMAVFLLLAGNISSLHRQIKEKLYESEAVYGTNIEEEGNGFLWENR